MKLNFTVGLVAAMAAEVGTDPKVEAVSTLNERVPVASPVPPVIVFVGAAASVTLTVRISVPAITAVDPAPPVKTVTNPLKGKLKVEPEVPPPLPVNVIEPFFIYVLVAPNVEAVDPAYAFQVNNRLKPPKLITFPGVLALAVKDNGAVPNKVRLLVKFKPIPAPDKVSVFIFLLEGIAASSVATTAATAGVSQLDVKLYNAIRAVGAVATVVKVPPAGVAVVIPTPTIGAAAYPKPALVMVKLVN